MSTQQKIIYFNLLAFFSALLCALESQAQTWTNLGSGMYDTLVHSLAIDASGNLYAGGGFTNAGGVVANRIAKWDGATWTNLGSGINRWGEGFVATLECDTSGNLYAGGWFTNAGGVAANNIAKWDGTTWTNLGSGMNIDVLTLNGYVQALACDSSGNLYVGGWFTNAGGMAANNIAKWDGTTWTSVGNGIGSGINGDIRAFAFDTSGNLYAGGWFTNAGGVAANNIAKWDGTTWINLGNGMNGSVNALAIDSSGSLYAGGSFTEAGGVAANTIAKWDGTIWTNLDSGINGFAAISVGPLACDKSGNLYAGGSFTNAGGVTANNIAKWDGTTWTNLGSGINRGVFALATDSSGNLYAGGLFTEAGGVTANSIAKWIPPVLCFVIKANDSTNDISISRSDTLSVTVQIDLGEYLGINSDWWVVARAGSSWYYMNNFYQWVSFDGNFHPVQQGPLFNLPSMEVLNLTGLADGSYTFYFAVDYPMDGVLNLDGPILVDSVNVIVQ